VATDPGIGAFHCLDREHFEGASCRTTDFHYPRWCLFCASVRVRHFPMQLPDENGWLEAHPIVNFGERSISFRSSAKIKIKNKNQQKGCVSLFLSMSTDPTSIRLYQRPEPFTKAKRYALSAKLWTAWLRPHLSASSPAVTPNSQDSRGGHMTNTPVQVYSDIPEQPLSAPSA